MNKSPQADNSLLAQLVAHVERIAVRLIALESQIRSEARLKGIEDRLTELEATREAAARE